MGNIYYVYQHVDADGSIVYIGKGKYDRAWSIKRQAEHATWMKQQDLFKVVSVIKNQLTEEEALEKESELILKYQPKFNRKGTEEDKAWRVSHGKWLSSNKSKFNDSEFQRKLGQRAACSEKHPNNQKGTCTHCGVTMNIGHIARYHNDNCKKRVSTNDTN